MRQRVRHRGVSPSTYNAAPKSSGCHTIDTHYTRLDQRLTAVAKADRSEDGWPTSAGFWSRLPNANRHPRQSGCRPTGGHKTDGIVLPGEDTCFSRHCLLLHSPTHVGRVHGAHHACKSIALTMRSFLSI